MKKSLVSFVTIFNLVVGIPFTQVYAQEESVSSSSSPVEAGYTNSDSDNFSSLGDGTEAVTLIPGQER